jgi:hypothetical protein
MPTSSTFTRLKKGREAFAMRGPPASSRGVVFEECDLPGLKTVHGIADIEGNYPSKGTGERAAWFRDSEGNMLGIGQAVG